MVRRPRRLAALAGALCGILGASLLGVAEGATPAHALTGAEFDPSQIISDANFFDANAMTEAEIQSFLVAQVGGCQNGRCLDVLTVAPTGKPADQWCSAGYGVDGGAERVSRIIYKVQQSCGISAKAILVILQKEQGLVTKKAPTDGALRAAMGYGCPDTAACDTQYYGIFNQIYQAARQFKRYAAPGSSFNWFPVGRPAPVQYHPDAACGASTITIQNKATAGLYYYTPYQPNAAALANLRGTGDGCSSYGNRNFWVFYNDWFGNPVYPKGTPDGALLSITGEARAVRVTGWAVDPDAQTAIVPVAVQIGANWFGEAADKPSTEAQAAYPEAGPNHGYDIRIPYEAGTVRVCVTLVNAGGAGSNLFYSCQTVVIPLAPAPVGEITLTDAGNAIGVTGWMVQPDAPTNPVTVAASIGANWYALESGKPNSVAPTKVTGAGPNQGVSARIPIGAGSYDVCFWAAPTAGPAVLVVCKSVLVASPAPVGAITSATGGAASITLSGWVARPDTPATAVDFAVNVGANWYAVRAGDATPASPSVAGSHGFTTTVPAPSGSQSVCIWAAPTAGTTVQLGCRTVNVGAAPGPATGEIASMTGVGGGVSFAGWAVRPDAPTAAVPVAVNIGASWYAYSTGVPNAVAPTKVTGAGPNQGFAGTLPIAPGTYPVCIWISGATGSVGLGCRTVTVPSSAATGEVASVTGAPGGVTFTGWAARPDTPTAAVPIAVNVGASWHAFSTGVANAVAPTKVPGAGPNQGFAGTIALTPGTYPVCVWASGGTGAVNLGCRTVTVASSAVTGEIASIAGVPGGVSFTGWSARPDAPTAVVPIALNVGASWYAFATGTPDAIAPTKVPGAGPNQGFTGTLALAPGTYPVCVWASGATGAVNLGCRTVTVPATAAAVGAIVSATGRSGAIDFSAWVVRPDAPTATVPVAVNIGSSWHAFSTGAPSSAAQAVVTGAGPNQGIVGQFHAARGAQTFCIWAAGTVGPAVNLGCTSVTVP